MCESGAAPAHRAASEPPPTQVPPGRAPARAPGRGRGCSRSGRHWVGLAIVAIQMAAWCLVGALLVHRGISNLQPPASRSAASPAADEDDDGAPPSALDASLGEDGAPPWRPSNQSQPSGEGQATAHPESVLYPEVTVSPKQTQWSFFPQSHPARPFASHNSLDVEVRTKDRVGDAEASLDPPFPVVRKGVATGAVTAVVMVTVGGVMLVVGPAFLLVKVIDVYQRQRRKNKLSQQEDPPPSYDEVAEKAPRYSALFQVLDSGELVPLAGTGDTALPVTVDPAEGEDHEATGASTPPPPLPSESESV